MPPPAHWRLKLSRQVRFRWFRSGGVCNVIIYAGDDDNPEHKPARIRAGAERRRHQLNFVSLLSGAR